MAKRKGTNPFYVLLVVLGIAFTLTACGYGVLMLRAARPIEAETSSSGTALLDYLDRHGDWLMTVELALLALATVGAIATDRYWMSREWRSWQQAHPKATDDEQRSKATNEPA